MGDVSSFTRRHLCHVESAEVELRKTVRKRICVYVESAKVDLRKGIRMRNRKTVRKRICVYVESAKDLRKGTHAHLCVIRCVRLCPHACAYVFIHQQLIWERCRHDV